MAQNSKEARERAEASFKKKAHQAREGSKAMTEYEAAGRAVSEKTARLKALRLAKEQSDRTAEFDEISVIPTDKPGPP